MDEIKGIYRHKKDGSYYLVRPINLMGQSDLSKDSLHEAILMEKLNPTTLEYTDNRYNNQIVSTIKFFSRHFIKATGERT